MNESTQEATGSRREQDEKAMTRKQELEENRADVAFGVFKKPRSKTVGLCTLMERDEEGWGGREGMSGEEGMVSYIAGRVVGGAQMGGSEVVGCGKPRENDGRSEDQEVRGRRRKREGS